MQHKSWPLYDAYDLMKRARPRVRPTDGFLRQLELYSRSSYNYSQTSLASNVTNHWPRKATVLRYPSCRGAAAPEACNLPARLITRVHLSDGEFALPEISLYQSCYDQCLHFVLYVFNHYLVRMALVWVGFVENVTCCCALMIDWCTLGGQRFYVKPTTSGG